EAGDLRIPGFPEREPHEGDRAGVLPNSALRTDSAALGASWIGARGFLGGAWSLYSARYGVPGHVHPGEDDDHDGHDDHDDHGHDDGHGDVRIVMDQRRSELRGGLDQAGPFDTLRLKVAHTTYTHTEFEGAAVGTVFDSDTLEGRLELVHAPVAGWRGAFGAQWSDRDFAAAGEEAFVPGSDTREAGLFWIGERPLPETAHGRFKLEAGARLDRVRVTPDAAAAARDRRFDLASASVALHWE